MPFSPEELEIYLTKNFMNAQVINKIEHVNNELELPSHPVENKEESFTERDTNVIFKYLENDSLSLDIQYQRDYLKQYNICLCMYNIDQSKRLPFIQYFLDLQNETYEFPSTQLNMKPFIDIYENKNRLLPSNDDEDDNDTGVDDEFIGQISTFFTSITNEKLDIETMYKGFLEDEKDNIFVFIEIPNVSYANQSNMNTVLMDEILNVQSVMDIPISQKTIELFKLYPFLQQLNTEGFNVQFPKIGYICETTQEGYVNLFKNDTDDVLLIPPTIDHQVYDNIYIFSAIPLAVSKNNNIRRFACFVENIDDNEEPDNGDDEPDNISFHENDIQFYSIYELDLFKEI